MAFDPIYVGSCLERMSLTKKKQEFKLIKTDFKERNQIKQIKLQKKAIQIIKQQTLQSNFDLQSQNSKLQAKNFMIKPRNQNRLPKPVENKPKPDKKAKKGKKQVSTDVQQEHKQVNIIKTPVIIEPKPKKSLPKVKCDFNPQDQVEQYEDEIITYLKALQTKYKVESTYLKYHSLLNVKVRSFLVKFLFKMTTKYKCKRSTLYLAVYCMDLYLSKNTNLHNNMEAIAVAQAALHISMKYEEIYPPSLKSWSPDSEQIKRILTYEADILKTIDFKLNLPSIYYFQQYFQKKDAENGNFEDTKENLYLEELKVSLISDICLFEVSLYDFAPFDLAKNIRMLVYNIEPAFGEERLILNIKWALERNKEELEWLKEHKYKELIPK